MSSRISTALVLLLVAQVEGPASSLGAQIAGTATTPWVTSAVPSLSALVQAFDVDLGGGTAVPSGLCASFAGPSAEFLSVLPISQEMSGAVGPNSIVSSNLATISVQSRSGALLHSVQTSTFTGTVAGTRFLYDATIGRFLVVNYTSAWITVGISASSDPLGAWSTHRYLREPGGTASIASSEIGTNALWVTVATNMVDPLTGIVIGTRIWAIDKAALVSGSTPAASRFVLIGPFGYTQPCTTYSATEATQYLVRTNGGALGELEVMTLSGPVNTPLWVLWSTPGVPVWGAPNPPAPQLGGPTVTTGNDRITSAVLRNGSLWCCAAVGEPALNPTHTAVRWWQVDPFGGALLQTGLIDDFASSGASYFSPSLAVSAADFMMIGYGSSSATTPLSANWCLRLPGTPPGTVLPANLLKSGDAPWNSSSWSGSSATVVDPVDDSTFWTLQPIPTTGTSALGLNPGSWWGVFDGTTSPATVTSITPSTVLAGSAALALNVVGTGFGTSDQVLFDGIPIATTFVSSTALTVGVPAALMVDDGASDIRVASGGCQSNGATFTVQPFGLPVSAFSLDAWLTVNGSNGTTPGLPLPMNSHRVDIDIGAPITISMTTPSPSQSIPFVIWGRLGLPSGPAFSYSGVYGDMCFTPCAIAPGDPLSFTLANSFGPDPCGPLVSSTPASWSLSLPLGVPFSLQVTLGGIALTGGVPRFVNDVLVNVR